MKTIFLFVFMCMVGFILGCSDEQLECDTSKNTVLRVNAGEEIPLEYFEQGTTMFKKGYTIDLYEDDDFISRRANPIRFTCEGECGGCEPVIGSGGGMTCTECMGDCVGIVY